MIRSFPCFKPLFSYINNSLSVSILNNCKSCYKFNISHVSNNTWSDFVRRQLHFSLPRHYKEDKRSLALAGPKKDDGTTGEKAMNIDALIQSRRDMFPTEETPNMMFRGVPFSEVPIVNIRVSRNNTIFSLSDAKSGEVKVYRSCGIEGFKNTRKGTNIAAQATAITFTSLVLNGGFKTVKVRIQGLGPGRMSSIKGLQMAGLDIISVTDSTRVSENPPRPRKRRRL